MKLPSLFVLTTKESWAAVSRGVVIQKAGDVGLSRLSIEVKSRIARASYGIRMRDTFNPKIHDGTDKVWDQLTREWKANNQIELFIEKVNCPDHVSLLPYSGVLTAHVLMAIFRMKT
jgi:hypothetical protein